MRPAFIHGGAGDCPESLVHPAGKSPEVVGKTDKINGKRGVMVAIILQSVKLNVSI